MKFIKLYFLFIYIYVFVLNDFFLCFIDYRIPLINNEYMFVFQYFPKQLYQNEYQVSCINIRKVWLEIDVSEKEKENKRGTLIQGSSQGRLGALSPQSEAKPPLP